ncbi:MAG: flagellar hook-basal body complex protein [Alphaproteobacteria bacterium]|nr:flagellar hook-basal body complex protein [Alphaproteobacteria bacterium]
MSYISVDRALHIAKTGLGYFTSALAAASQNLAATGVTGYKKSYTVGVDLPYTRQDPAGAASSSNGTKNPTGIEIGLGVRVAAVERNFAQGDLAKTDNPLDLAVSGDGFFEILLPDGTTAYTRAGVFTISATGMIVTQPSGYTVSPGITFPANTTGVKITEDGLVFAQIGTQTTLTQVGQLTLATFMNPSGLAAMGDTMFQETEASGSADSGTPGTSRRGKLKQGYRESSNSNTLEDVIELMRIEKHYNFLTKVLVTASSIWEQDARIGA